MDRTYPDSALSRTILRSNSHSSGWRITKYITGSGAEIGVFDSHIDIDMIYSYIMIPVYLLLC